MEKTKKQKENKLYADIEKKLGLLLVYSSNADICYYF